jgi:predicted PurR-regulated permease PerM
MDTRLTRLILVAGVVILIIIGGLGFLVQINSRNIDKLDTSVANMQVQINHLERFVSDLEEQTPEEQAENDAVQQAVTTIPELKSILCQAFPEVPECVNG